MGRTFRVIFLGLMFCAAPAYADDACQELTRKIANVNQQIADIEAERAMTAAVKDMSEALNEAIEDLNGSKDNAEAYAEKLGDLEDLLGDKFQQVGEVVSGTKAGTEKLQSALGDTADGLSKAQLAFRIYTEKRKRGDNTDPAETLKTLAASYDFLKDALGPLIETVPVIGQFLDAYGEALESASKIASDLQDKRREQAAIVDQIPELNGGNPFRFPTAKDRKLKELQASLAKLSAQAEEKGCEPVEPAEPEEAPLAPEVAQADAAAKRACMAKLGLTYDPEIAYLNAVRERDRIIIPAFHAAKKSVDEAAKAVTSAEDAIAKEKENVRKYKQAKADALEIMRVQPGYAGFLKRMRKQAPGFPGTVTKQSCLIAKTFAENGTARLISSLDTLCLNALEINESDDRLAKANSRLEAARATLVDAKAKLESLAKQREAAYEKAEKERQNKDRLRDCIDANSDYIDVSGRYWVRETGDVIKVTRRGPNYLFNYEEISASRRAEYKIAPGDEWAIGRLKKGRMDGIFLDRFPRKVVNQWGCPDPTGWVNLEGLIWGSGEWLSFTPKTRRINGNCKVTAPGSVITIYKEGSRTYKQYYRR